MRILSIETSCDETAVSVVEVIGEFPTATYTVLGNALFSQIDLHREYGGVFPALAKREHAKTLVPMLDKALTDAELSVIEPASFENDLNEKILELLNREPGMGDALIEFLNTHARPEIDLIAVTSGPGLEPALWVGVNFAKALALAWNISVVPVDHMEGHIFASIFDVVADDVLVPIAFPALALLISGGHTELILMKSWGSYEKIGATRDDAVGEAFDKVARLMGLPYPGGPEISRRAGEARAARLAPFKADMPRPMIDSDNFDFSFSGIKTSVRYSVEGKELSDTNRMALSRDFEDAVIDVLLKKTERAIDQYDVRTLIVGGGVSANRQLRDRFNISFLHSHPELAIYFPKPGLATDNSVMIALAGHARSRAALSPKGAVSTLRADGNRSLA